MPNETPIANGLLQGDLDCDEFALLNVGLAGMQPVVAPVSPSDGDLYNDSSAKALRHHAGGLDQRVSGVIFTQGAVSGFSNNNAEATVFDTGHGSLDLPAGLLVPGKAIRIMIEGVFSFDIAAVSFTLRAKLGASTVVAISGAVPSDVTDAPFKLQTLLVCSIGGATGLVAGSLSFQIGTEAASVGAGEVIGALDSAVIDLTGALTMDVTAQFNTADSGAGIAPHVAVVEVLN